MKRLVVIGILLLCLSGCSSSYDNYSDSFAVSLIESHTQFVADMLASRTDYETQRLSWTNTTTENINIPIYMYHDVNMMSDYSDGNSIPIERLEQHFSYFKEQGYTSISLDDYYEYVSNGLAIPRKSIIITFDDGYKTMLDVSELLIKYDLFATTFLIGAKTDVDTTYHLSSQDIIHIKDEQHLFFGTHTTNMHGFGSNRRGLIETIDFNAGVSDINSQDNVINSNTLCYPFGHYNLHAQEMVIASGKKLAVTTEYGFATKTTDLTRVPRIRVSASSEYPALP